MLAGSGFAVTPGVAGLPTAFSAEVGYGATGGGGLRRVRRTSRYRPCLRPQHHRRVRGRCRIGLAGVADRAGSHRPGARHAGRGRGRGQGPHARTGRVRRRARGDDGPPLAGGPARRHLPRGLPLRRDLHRPERSRLGRPLGGGQRGGRDGRRRRSPSACSASSSDPATRCTGWSSTAAVPPTSSPRAVTGRFMCRSITLARPGGARAEGEGLLRGRRAGDRVAGRVRVALSGVLAHGERPAICSASTGSNAERLGRRFDLDDQGVPPPTLSTDMANVSLAVPTIHPLMGIEAGGRGQPPARVRRGLRQRVGGQSPARRRDRHGLDGDRRSRTGPGPGAPLGGFALRVTGDGNFGIRMGNVSLHPHHPPRIERARAGGPTRS